MRDLLKILIIVLSMGFSILPGRWSLYAEESVFPVAGRVIDENEKPIQGAAVKLSYGGYADTTDVSGHFKFSPIPAGIYVLSVSMPFLALEDIHRNISLPMKDNETIKIVMKNRTYRIDEVVVLSSSQDTRGELEKIPSFVTVVERSEFENNASTVADVIASTPGVNINVMGGLGNYTEVSIRGSYSNQVQVYIDGMLLNEAIGGAVNLASIPLIQVESVEIWRSGAPAQFGGDAAGGVVNIKTRDNLTLQKTFSLGYGSYNTFTSNTVFNIPMGMSRFHATLDYSSSDNNFEYMSDNGTMYNKNDDYWARRNNDEFHSTNLLSKFSHVLPSGTQLEFSEHILSNKKNLPGKDNIRYSSSSLETVKNLFQGKVTLNPFFHNILRAQPTFYHIYSHERYRDPHGEIGWGIQDNVYNSNAFTFMAPFTVNAGNYAVFNLTPMTKQEYFRPDYKLQSETIPLSSDREYFSLAGDVFFKTSDERLTITSNLKRDRYFSSYSGEPSILNLKIPGSKFNYMTNSNAGLKLRVLNNFTVQGNYGDITRVPSLYELFGDRGGTLSNPDLKPEHIYRWDVGGRFWSKKKHLAISGSLECSYFENTYKDLIQWYANDAGFIHPDNVAGSYVKGTEIIWNTMIFDRLTFLGNWTFQQSKVTEEKRKYYRDKKLPNRPNNYGNMKLEYPLKEIALFWTFNRKSSYYLDRTNQDHKLYPGRTLQDVGISVSLKNGKATCNFIAKNVGDVHTFDIIGMPKPGRSYMITFVYTMN